MQMKKLPRKNSSTEESFSQANSTLFFLYLQLHYAYRNIVTKRMGCCNSAVSALKGQLFFCSMKHMKREKGQLFLWSCYLENSSSIERLGAAKTLGIVCSKTSCDRGSLSFKSSGFLIPVHPTSRLGTP